jgi:hypothetical protein
VPPTVARYINDLTTNTQRLSSRKDDLEQPKSFGVYLGSFNGPPSTHQSSLLQQWDLIVVDPANAGVFEAVYTKCKSSHIVSRVEVASVVQCNNNSDAADIIQSIGTLAQYLSTHLKRKNHDSPFTGILLSEWKASFSPVICNEIVKFINKLGLDVYLEVSGPDFLNAKECRQLNMERIKGIICRNGSILEDGDRRNCYQMNNMQPILRAVAAQACVREITLMMWEIIHDEVKLDLAVAKRSFVWYRYFSAISWIGPRAALNDAKVAYTRTIADEPLGALMWLKNDKIIDVQEVWRLNDKVILLDGKRNSLVAYTVSQINPISCNEQELYNSLEAFIPNLRAKLSLFPYKKDEVDKQVALVDSFDWTQQTQPQTNPFSFSPRGNDYTGLGCFAVGLDGTAKDFHNLCEQQRHLRSLNLLDPLKSEQLRGIVDQLYALYEAYSSLSPTPDEVQAVRELIKLVNSMKGEENDRLRIYFGLDSGFKTNLDTQFWGLYDVDPSSGITDIYVSAKARDLAGTILHTFMSARGFTRSQCFMAELALSEQSGNLTGSWQLPPRICQDMELLAPAETMLFLQRLTISNRGEYPVLCARVRSACEYQLLEVPTLAQLKNMNAAQYLRGEISGKDLVTARVAWYREKGCRHPNLSVSISLFQEIEARIYRALMDREAELLERVESVLLATLKPGKIDASADIFALSVFSAFRKLALDEAYLEVMDRNPFPNPHTDQAACFAEMFSMGSRCEWYLGVTPNILGEIITERYKEYYKKYPIPLRDDTTTEIPSAYSSSQIDLDPDHKGPTLPAYYRVTFLGIFAVPALIDIMLLTTLGRGVYLTTYMSETEKSMATNALMAALFLCGAIGNWISSGGSYYLHSMAFGAMNMFVLSRFLAGVAICVIGGLIALVIIGIVKGFYAGLIFFIYFVFLTTYLSSLATLAIYQLPDFMFQSGRLVIMQCIPILLISPILTLWVHHDIIIYPCVMGLFLISLILGARRIIAKWGTWYHNIPTVTDKDVAAWYMKTAGISAKDLAELGASPLPRKTLQIAVDKELNSSRWSKSTSDELVRKLAEGHEATIVLMDWYCKYSRTKMPFPYSPTWNLQTKAAVDTLRDMQKGLKLHNAFVHWRHAGSEVWCGVLYFVLALLDKWVALISGGSIVGLSAANSTIYRLAVGFGLAYYLFGAVALDSVAQPLWTLANKKTPTLINSLEALRQAGINDARAKAKIYWSNLVKFFFLHIWGLSLTTALMWAFNVSQEATIMYLAYVCAYSGLLWYQYNKIFTGPLALKDLLIAVTVGLPVGLVLHRLMPSFAYSSVIALGSATWTAAFLSLFTSDIGTPSFKTEKSALKSMPVYFAHGTLGPRSGLSQATLQEIFNSISALPSELRYRLNPATHPGIEVMDNLVGRQKINHSSIVRNAFRSGEQIIHQAAELWENGSTVIDLVPTRHLIRQEQKMRAISRTTGNLVHIFIFVGLDLVGDEWVMDIRRNCKVIAESIINATAESRLGFSTDHATLAELLTGNTTENNETESLEFISEGARRQLENSEIERVRVITSGQKAILKPLLLGLDCDTEWDNLPREIRVYLINRCRGQRGFLTYDDLKWINAKFGESGKTFDIEEYIARCNLGVCLAYQVNAYAEALESDLNHRDLPEPPDSSVENCLDFPLSESANDSERKLIEIIRRPIYRLYQSLTFCIKFFIVTTVADPEYQRELDYLISTKPAFIRWPLTFFLDGLWNICKTLQEIVLPLFLFHGRENVYKLYTDMKGMKTVIKKNKIVVESLKGPSTCFFMTQPDGTLTLQQYTGRHDKQPSGLDKLQSINHYSKKLVLLRREEYAYNARVNLFTYEYPDNAKGSRLRGIRSRLPIQRQCIEGNLNRQVIQYDERGYITSGSAIKDDNLVEFQFWYRKHAKFDDELIRAEYVLPHISVKVWWCVPPARNPEKVDKWIPHSKVTEATFIQGAEVYNSKWHYDHKFHPVILTTLNGKQVTTPPMIEHDWFDVLKKPRNCSFVNDNPLFLFDSARPSFISRLLRLNAQWYPISTSRARTHLWKSWKDTKDIDAVTARWLDEIAVRKDRLMRPYWKARDWGRLKAAEEYINSQSDTIMARIDVDPEISSWTPLAFKISDFCAFGLGGDSRINTRSITTQIQDTETNLHILAMDTGTWPYEGGGVSACRRDMVNNLETVKWHILAEMANDYGYPRFQIEKNVQSLTILPLWGLDFLTPTHGIFQNCLDSEVQQKSHDTQDTDILKIFIPLLTTLVRCSRANKLELHHLDAASKALVDLNKYFQSSRHWSEVWKSDVVKKVWYELWLSDDTDNTRPSSDWMESECPTLAHLDNALDMWHRCKFNAVFAIL